ESRKAQRGKSLEYIPPILRNGKKCVTIVEDDLNEIASYWKSALIGFVIGDTPYMKSIENFIQATRKKHIMPQFCSITRVTLCSSLILKRNVNISFMRVHTHPKINHSLYKTGN
ncbi:hypothetical protein MTR67_034503, partial [Solanum verrucosum]